MKRIFPDYTYGPGPRGRCWWDETTAAPNWPCLKGDMSVDVAVIGGGFTGITAALRLAEAGLHVAVCEAGTPGWGASGRNGGFCCLGGGKISNTALNRQFGTEGRQHYRATEKAAVQFVADQLERHGIDADTHSQGETMLAHNSRAAASLEAFARAAEDDYGIEAEILAAEKLAGKGMQSNFFGAVTIPIGFALNPRKYLFGLANAAAKASVHLFQKTEITKLTPKRVGFALATTNGQIHADRIIVATNGYSSDDLPPWLSARYLPAQSSVLVTRQLSDAELVEQGWTSRQMCYDSRNLLHYFRLMPDNRMLFGMRGGLLSSPRADAAALDRVRRDFEAFFPAWAQIDTPFSWSGMVCLAGNATPFAGPIPDMDGAFAAFGYHGNGVAMGSMTGHLVAGQLLGEPAEAIPAAMRQPAATFPLGRYRRLLLGPLYLGLRIADL